VIPTGPEKRNFLASLHYRIPITTKMVIFSIAIGLGVWAVMDSLQTRKLKDIFQTQVSERLKQAAVEDRVRFDNVINIHLQLVKLVAGGKKFHDFIDFLRQSEWAQEGDVEVVYSETPPLWFPKPSILRALVNIRYALLLDGSRRVREVYRGYPEELP